MISPGPLSAPPQPPLEKQRLGHPRPEAAGDSVQVEGSWAEWPLSFYVQRKFTSRGSGARWSYISDCSFLSQHFISLVGFRYDSCVLVPYSMLSAMYAKLLTSNCYSVLQEHKRFPHFKDEATVVGRLDLEIPGRPAVTQWL